MCLLCVEWQKGKMSYKELIRNAGEIYSVGTKEEKEHMEELITKVEQEYMKSEKPKEI